MQNLTCQQVQEKLLAAESVEGVFTAHVQQCPQCAPLAAKLLRLETAARRMPEPVVIGPSEAFLAKVRALPIPERPAVRRVLWMRRSAAAAIILAVGLMALSVCLMNTRPARADAVLRDLVAWNLQIGASHDHAQRQQLYEQQVAGMKKEVTAAALPAAEAKLADILLKNAEWLEKADDRLAEAAHFAAIAEQMKAAGINVSEMNALQTDLLKQGVQGNLQKVQPEELSPAQKQQFKQLQQESDPAIPTGLQPLSTPPQTGAIHTPYLPEPPRTLTSLESPKAAPGPTAWNRDPPTPGTAVVLRPLPPAGGNLGTTPPPIIRSGGPPAPGINGNGNPEGSRMPDVPPGFAAAGPGPILPPVSAGIADGANLPGRGWVSDADGPDRDADAHVLSAPVPVVHTQVAPAMEPAIGGVAADPQRALHDQQITGQTISGQAASPIPLTITSPTAITAYLIPPQNTGHDHNASPAMQWLAHTGATHEYTPGSDPDDLPQKSPAGSSSSTGSPSSTVASGGASAAATPSAAASPGATPGATAASAGGAQHAAAADGDFGGDADSDGSVHHSWHHWNWQSADGGTDSTSGTAGSSWPFGNDPQAAGDASADPSWTTDPSRWASDDTCGTGWQGSHDWRQATGPWPDSAAAESSGPAADGSLAPSTATGNVSVVIAPEPAAGMIALIGFLLLFLRRRPSRHASAR